MSSAEPLYLLIAFLAGMGASVLAWLVADRFILRQRRVRSLIRRDSNRAALQAQARLAQMAGKFILVAGDSTLANVVVSPVDDLPVVDVTLPGLTTSAFADRIGAIMNGQRPFITVLSLGANNALQSDLNADARHRFRADMKAILASVAGMEMTVIVTPPPLQSGAPEFGERAEAMAEWRGEVEDFARSVKAEIVDCTAALRAAPAASSAQSDGLHLSPQGAKLLAQAIHGTMVRALRPS